MNVAERKKLFLFLLLYLLIFFFVRSLILLSSKWSRTVAGNESPFLFHILSRELMAHYVCVSVGFLLECSFSIMNSYCRSRRTKIPYNFRVLFFCFFFRVLDFDPHFWSCIHMNLNLPEHLLQCVSTLD